MKVTNKAAISLFCYVFLLFFWGCGGGGGSDGGGKGAPAASVNPLDVSLSDPGALTLVGLSKNSINPRSGDLQFQLTGAEFFPSLEGVSVTVNGVVVSTNGWSIQADKIVGPINLEDGRNEIQFKAYDKVGRPLYLTETIWAGANVLTVNLIDSNGVPFVRPVNVRLSLSDDPNIAVTSDTSTATLTFQNIPSRTVVVEARSDDNLVGVVGGVGSDGIVTIKMLNFAAPSAVSNNDLALGLNGWNIGTSPATIIAHAEGFPSTTTLALLSSPVTRLDRANALRTTPKSLGPKQFPSAMPADITDNDLQLATSGEGAQSLSRTFATSTGTTSVVVRYRFVTSEVPGGYFGSKFNDYFSVSLRSQGAGAVASESNTMNGLGLSAFDFASGATPWRTVTLNTNPAGDVIQLDVSVANVADGLLDSMVIIDFVSEKQDKVQPSLAWNSTAGGLTLSYVVEGSALQNPVTLEVFWASGATYASRMGAPLFTYTVPAGTPVGPGAPVAIPGASLVDDPNGTTRILAASSETKVGSLPDVQINYGANANATAVSAGMSDLIKDGLRAAGQANVTITSTARTPADQARAMFQNLVNPANPIATNIANQLALYGAPGDAVVNVFATQSNGLTLAEVNAQSATIQAAMVTEINNQGPSNVSRHCADPTVISVVDVGGAAFNATNGPLFRASVTPRVTHFIDEISTNNAYHLELQ